MVKFHTEEGEGFTLMKFELEGAIGPEELRTMTPPRVDATQGVVLSGRGPVWLFAALVHHYHPVAWVGTYDPRLGGAVVVESHVPSYKVGDVVKIEEEDSE